MSIKKTLVIVGFLLGSGAVGVALKLRQRPLEPAARPTPAAPLARTTRPLVPLNVAETVYDGKLGPGWADWGWGRHELSQSGPAKIVFGGYGGIVFRHTQLDARFGALSFRYKAPPGWPEFLSVELKGGVTEAQRRTSIAVEPRHEAILPDGWREVLIDFSELNPDRSPFERVVLSANSPVASDWVLLDKVVLAQSSTQGQVTLRQTAQLAVSCRAATRKISPLIYGASQDEWSSGVTALRVGGNPTTRFNWDLGVWNAGSDWFFENGKAIDLPGVLDAALNHGARTALTVPMIGWVAKDDTAVGFPRSLFAQQRKFDPNRPLAGDGFRPDGSAISPPPPSQTSIAASPELIGRWVRALRDKSDALGKRRVDMYILDNEPSLWDQTHRDVHPSPLSYDELLDRTLRYASQVRKADPGALIAGPAEWGWLGYMYSGRDRVAGTQARPDRRAHGDMPLIPYYLSKIADREQRTGVRLLDVLDVHFYPAAKNLYGADARVDAEAAALRLRSTRALWDPSYVDESWINESINLIPRLKAWIAAYHPGLMLSLGEWSFGGDQHISGALATAEALGRFGQQGLDAAFYWGGPVANSGTFWAFRAYRNFDGEGGRFQDISLSTTERNNVSVFASRDSGGDKVVTILLNKNASAIVSARLEFEGCGRIRSNRIFRYASGDTELVAEPPAKIEGQWLTTALPPYSLTVVAVDANG